MPLSPIVGFPDESGIFVTKTDVAALTIYLLTVRNWIEAASACLEAAE
jgi:hypothetical protein